MGTFVLLPILLCTVPCSGVTGPHRADLLPAHARPACKTLHASLQLAAIIAFGAVRPLGRPAPP